MNIYLLIIASLCYYGTAIEKGLEGNLWWFLFWSCYGTANLAWIGATR